MGISNYPACRTNSLPAQKRSSKRCRKVKPRVSFSSLPPARIEFESEIDPSVAYVDKETLFNARIALFHNEKSGNRDEIRPNTENEKFENRYREQTNDLDSVNEMLLDIIEEIEAENVTVEDCLRDAVSLKVLDVEEAQNILPDFESKRKGFSNLCDVNNNDFGTICNFENAELEAETEENVMDKLIDLFSTLKTEDLSKCCKFTLGKLCQLTSYEDYENVQKIAASSLINISAAETDLGEEISSASSGYPDDSSIEMNSLSSSSSESFECSSLESENDFTPKFQKRKSMIPNFRNEKTSIQNALRSLIDEGILKPKQAWKVLESGRKDEMLNRFMKEISTSYGTHAFKTHQKDIESTLWMLKTREYDESCDSASDLGYCSNQSDIDSSPTVKPRSSLRRSNSSKKFSDNLSSSCRRPFTITSARSNNRETPPRTSTPQKSHQSGEFTEQPEGNNSLFSWCDENDLPPSIAWTLKCRGCQTKEDLLDLEVADIQQLTELSWPVKGRVWVAIESLRLYRKYIEYKTKLEQCSKGLKSLPL